jgi:hypothetical protein
MVKIATAEDRAASAGLPGGRDRKRSLAATAMLRLSEYWPDVRPLHKSSPHDKPGTWQGQGRTPRNLDHGRVNLTPKREQNDFTLA